MDRKKKAVLLVGGTLVALAALCPHFIADLSVVPQNWVNDRVAIIKHAQAVDRVFPWEPRPLFCKLDVQRTAFEVAGLAFLTLALCKVVPGSKD